MDTPLAWYEPPINQNPRWKWLSLYEYKTCKYSQYQIYYDGDAWYLNYITAYSSSSIKDSKNDSWHINNMDFNSWFIIETWSQKFYNEKHQADDRVITSQTT